MKIKYSVLVICILLALLPGIIGGLFTANTVDSPWYDENKPSFTPPNWLFGPVWTLLYLMIGISLYIAWTSSSGKKRQTVAYLFLANLILNGLWSIFFFAMQNPLLALFDIILLWLTISALIFYNYKISRVASYLLIPYILWVSFATVLNIGFLI